MDSTLSVDSILYGNTAPSNPAPLGIPLLTEDFEGTWLPTGWTQIITDAGAGPGGNPFAPTWVQETSQVHSGTYGAGTWWDYVHQDEWLITPEVTLTGSTTGNYYVTFWTYGWEGSIYDDHYYVKISTNNGTTWTAIFDLSDLTGNNWNAWAYPYTIDLDAYAGDTVKLAWQAIDCNDPGNPNYPGLWYIWAIDDVEVGYFDVPDDDVGVTAIIAPVSGTATGPIIPKATVENFGGADQTNVPVDMEITRYGSPSTIFADGFESYVPGQYVFPAGWTVQTTNPTGTWYMYQSSATYSASTYPRVQEALSDGNAQAESLISPTIDCSALASVNVQFTKAFYAYTPDFATFTVYGSIDGGATWPNTVVTYSATSTTAENIACAWAIGQANVKFKFEFVSAADATLSSYLYFDNFWVGTYSLFGPLGDNPPVGWTITDPSSPSPWTNNFWHRYTTLYTSYDSMYYPARVYYTSPYVDVNTSLTSPSIDCSALSTVNLYLNGYFYYYASNPGRGYIEVSTDGGTTWADTGAITNTGSQYFYEFDGVGPLTYRNNLDISAWAAGMSNVKVRFRYQHTAAEAGRYWYLGNVRVGSDRENIIFRDSFQGPQAYSTNFKIFQNDDWTPWAWNQVTGTSTGNKWLNMISGSSPTCTPFAGSRMAEYNSYSATTGDQARIYTNAFDASSAVTMKTSFAMFHDSTTYQTTADKIQVQASTDNGATWTNAGDPFYRSCTLQGLPLVDGWRTWIVDLTPYAGSSSLRIGFLATSQFGYNMFIDDVDVFDPGLIYVYTNTVYVDVDAGDTVEAVFPSWTPSAWQTQQNVDVTYDVAAETDLTGDADPSNDAAAQTFTLHFPYFHDIEVLSIDSPITNGPGQTQQVKATIKNIGQYAERNFFVPVQIGEKVYSTTGYYNNFEASNGGFTQAGGQWEWGTPTSGPGAAHSGAKLWATKLAGNYVAGLATLDTVAITVPTGGDLTFWHWYDYEASYDGCNVKISTNGGTTWTLITPIGGYTGTGNSANPLGLGAPCWTGHVQKFWEYETFDLAAYEGMSVMFRFSMGADSSVFYPGTYLDDILVGNLVITIVPEYDESAAVAAWLYPGQSLQLTYPDWTPDNLAIGTSGNIEYGVKADAQNTGDNNTGNNQMVHDLILSYHHDIGVKKIVSPAKGTRDLLFHQRPFLPTESWTFRTSAGTYLCQDNFDSLTAAIGNIEFWGLCLIYSAGWTPGNAATLPFQVKFYQDNAGAPGTEVASFNLAATTPVNTGLTYSGFTMYKWTYDLPTVVVLADGWMSVQSQTAPDNAWLLWGGSPEGDLSMYQQGATTPHIAGDCAFNLSGTPSPIPPVQLYLKAGTQPISAIVNNLGEFVETGLTCYAEITDYSADPNGTVVYTENVAGITLDPMGDEETLTFASYNFQDEGVYGLKFNFPLGNDDIPGNNMKSLGIGIDKTNPVSTHAISPATPNGLNGWYIGDVTITLTATDPEVNEVSSGVAKIEYQVNGGSWQTYSAPFKVTTDNAAHVVKYRATDKVGNVEAEKTVPSFKIDKTIPIIAMNYTWEKVGSQYNIIMTATCNDAMSGMSKVEFFFNGVLQETVTGAGPDYVWTYVYAPLPNVVVKAKAYDNAGWTAEVEILNPHSASSQASQTVTVLKQPLVK